MNAVLEANVAQIERAEDMIEESGAKSVGFVGISFKPGTDDLRESPLVTLAARLIDKGIKVEIYDPFVKEAFDAGTPGAGRGNEGIPDLEARLTGDIDALIDRAGTVLVGNYYAETVEKLKQASPKRKVVDLTRVHRDMVSDGSYAGICW